MFPTGRFVMSVTEQIKTGFDTYDVLNENVSC